MSGKRTAARKPILLLLVFGVFLGIVGITAFSQAILISTDFSTSVLESYIGNDAATVRGIATAFVRPSDLVVGSTTPTAALLQGQLDSLVEETTTGAPPPFLRVEIRLPDGTLVKATDPSLVGTRAAASSDFSAAAAGVATVGLDPVAESEALGPALPASTVLREYFPLQADGRVLAVVGLWRDAGPILVRLDAVRRDVIVVTLSAAAVATFVLFLVFRAAQARISRQTEQLVEATRRDPLTDTPNHGALVEELAGAIEIARTKGEPIGIVLVDIDNFRLLNDTHGHAAGDQAILTVAELLRAEFPAGTVYGRYGPDEFLVMDPSADVEVLEHAIDRLRSALTERALQFGESERLPVTISAGICSYPQHADSVTALLTVAAVTLHEAKASGGDVVRIAGVTPDVPAETRTFDVFQGLILAVDAKDRYTKRHSEDVARYSVFLAERLGLDPETVAIIRVAGLLHDVGKIGIPDGILRKPARLTDEEYRIVKQHVALGDLIVRDLPNVDIIRAGVRHHHERWDGTGYLHGLAGEEIPLIARILAVGDAFSAMTTTRPYRKAIDIREALSRLEDAAGTQLEERLVAAFVDGIKNVGDSPLPGETTPTRLWTPYAK
ncbi:MAG: bifunctional diguanylate cyclase/phosphohydrolase, partial [Candidatus Limnocylindrales bacterium]